MKYDFSTYILNKLNEAGEEKKPATTDNKEKKKNITINNNQVYISPETTEKELKNWITNHINLIDIENDKLVYEGDNGKYTFLNKSKNIKDVKKLYTEVQDQYNKSNNLKNFNKNGFELLGQTIAYRAALTLLNAESTSGDSFKQAALDAFKDESEYSIKQLENLDSLLDYSAAIETISLKKKRIDNNDKNAKKEEKKLNDYEEALKTPQKYTAIQNIKKEYEKEFKENRDIFENAFTEGMAKQKKKMQEKDYKWEDPATGQPPKGKMAKANIYGDKLFKKLQDLGEKADSWIKNQHGMDYVILKSCSLAIKGLVFGGKTLFKLLSNAYKKSNLKNTMNNREKLDEVKNKIDVFVKEFNEWNNKASNNKKDEKDKTEEEKKNEENEKKTILMKFSELMNTHIIPYYYCKLCIIDACFENLDNKYIIRQENNKWSTFNTSNQKRSIITDNAILANNILDYIIKKLQIPFEKFAEESSTDAFKSIPKDLKYNDSYNKNIVKWIDKVKTPYEDSNVVFDAKKFKTITEVYNNEVIKITFNSYKEFFEYCKKVQPMFKNCKVPALVEQELTIEGDEEAGVPGVITGAKKEETKEEKPEEKQNDENEYDTIVNQINKELKELKSFNELKDVANNFQKAAKDIDTGYKQVKELNNKLPDTQKTELKNMFKDDITNVFGKLMYINVSKKMNGITESFSYNKMMTLLLLENNGENDNYDDLLNILSNENMDSETVKEFKDKYKTFAEEMFNWYKELKNNNKDVAAALEKVSTDPLALYLARKTLNKPKEENQDEKPKEGQTEEPKEKSGENNQES